MALYTFYQVFKFINDQTIEALNRTQIGDVILEKGEAITKGTIIGGIDFFRYLGHEMEVEVKSDGTYIVKRVYI